jgi:signal transduction histidine kinase
VLLVLPTLVLGYLQWHHIVREKENELAEVPRDAEDAALRLRKLVQEELDKLIASESQRPIEQYNRYYISEVADGGSFLQDTPLVQIPRPMEIQAWFAFDLGERGPGTRQTFFGGETTLVGHQTEMEEATADLRRRFVEDAWMQRSIPIAHRDDQMAVALRVVAASAAGLDDADCLQASQMALSELVPTIVGDFDLLFYRDETARPRLVAHRHVLVEPVPELVAASDCLQRVSGGRRLVQGFFLDPQWFFDALPLTAAANVLTKRETFLREGETCCGDDYYAEVRLVGDLGFESAGPDEAAFGKVRIAIDTQDVEGRFRARAWRFFGVALMLALALSTGVYLLGRSVQKDLEQAARTENFVAAVTHELRTPLSSIKLHGEMLLEGWAKDPAKQTEYYRRIVRETERLSMLVERVLEKARLGSGQARVAEGDLASEVGRHVEKLHGWRTTEARDLEFDLPEGLPIVWLSSESVASILVNLVENARKYAPVDPSKPGAEPIRVVVREHGGGVALEVQDRGPGVPESERERVFEAFYRVGNEATRTARGTGLGLHLVAMHSQSVGARAEVVSRDGGGSIFRVTFAKA